VNHRLRDAIGTPVELHQVASAEAYVQRAKEYLVAHGGLPVLAEATQRPPAYVSHGAWVCQCVCGNGCSAHPDWGIAVCYECGALYRPVFPRQRAAGEAVLLRRPDHRTRNWFPHDDVARRHGLARGEPVAALERENAARGVPPTDREDAR
jgi:hypothetical protein